MKEPRNWADMPDVLMVNILQRLGTRDLFIENMHKLEENLQGSGDVEGHFCEKKTFRACDENYDFEMLTKQAVDLSCGELIDIEIKFFGRDHVLDHLVDHIVRRSNKLKRLCLRGFDMYCFKITGSRLCQAVKRLPQLEKLHLYNICIKAENIEVIGRNCPQLKSFIMSKIYRKPFKCDDYAFAIANSMPQLTHLELFGSVIRNDGLEAILNGCPHLQSLDIRECHNLYLGRELGILCMERINDFKHDLTQLCEDRFRTFFTDSCCCGRL